MNLQLHCVKRDGYDGLEVLVSGGPPHAFFIAKGERFLRTAYSRVYHWIASSAELGDLDNQDLDEVSLVFTADVPDTAAFLDSKGCVR